MLPLAKMRQEIQAIKKSNHPAAVEGFLFKLQYNDDGLYMLFDGDKPYFGLHAASKSMVFHLFSTKELAEDFLKDNQGLIASKLSTVELVQLAKSTFLYDYCVFMLNENDQWIAFPQPLFLKVFANSTIHEPDLYNPLCVDAIEFTHETKHNTIARYGLVCAADGQPVIDGETCQIVSAKQSGVLQPGQSLRPINIQSLFHLPAEKISVRRNTTVVDLPAGLVLSALALCGYQQKPDYTPPADYFDSPDEGLTLSDLRKWRTEDISVNFQPVEVPNPQTPAAETEEGTTPVSEPSEAQDDANKDSDFLSAAKAKCFVTAQLLREKASGASQSIRAKFAGLRQKHTQANPEEKAADGDTSTETLEQNPPVDEKARKRKMLITGIAAMFAILIVCVGLIATVNHIRYTRNFNAFCGYLDDRDFGNAYTLYTENNFRDAGTQYLNQTMENLVLQYAKNQISAEELSAALQALTNFPTIADELTRAKLTAAQLESSKNAYVNGKNSQDTLTRLDVWRQVIQLDEINYNAALQSAKDNRAVYEEDLNSQLLYYDSRNYDFAKLRYDILKYWYPDSELVTSLSEKYDQVNTTPLSTYPIKIRDIHIRQEANGYWTLYIDWKNTSAKTIESVRFSLVAKDEKGDIVTCTDSQGSWTIFDALDRIGGPYEPGEGTPSSSYLWRYAWYGSLVASAELTGVSINYRDGSTASYTSPTDLAAIYVN